MPQDVTDLGHGCPGVEEMGRQGVTQEIRALKRDFKFSPLQGAPHHRADRDRVGKTPLWGLHADENTAGRTARSHVAEIGHPGLANVLRERHQVPLSAWASDEECARLPVQVISRHGDDFARSQPQASQQE